MKLRHHLFFIFNLVIMSSFLFTSYAQEKKIDKKELPKKVLASFQKSYPKAEIKGVSTEKEHGKTYYEIESVEGSTNRDVTFTENGKLVVIEKAVSLDDVPVNVKNSLHKNYPKAIVLKSEKITEGKKITYELLIEENENKSEVVFNSKGKVVKVEKKKNVEEDND